MSEKAEGVSELPTLEEFQAMPPDEQAVARERSPYAGAYADEARDRIAALSDGLTSGAGRVGALAGRPAGLSSGAAAQERVEASQRKVRARPRPTVTRATEALFEISRREFLQMVETKLKSGEELRASIQGAIDEVTAQKNEMVDAGRKDSALEDQLDRQIKSLQAGIKVIDDAMSKATFLRDHLAGDDDTVWPMSAEQILEVRTALEPFKVDIGQLRLAADPGEPIRRQQHNFLGRKVRM